MESFINTIVLYLYRGVCMIPYEKIKRALKIANCISRKNYAMQNFRTRLSWAITNLVMA